MWVHGGAGCDRLQGQLSEGLGAGVGRDLRVNLRISMCLYVSGEPLL